MAKAKDLSAEDIGKVITVDTTTIQVEGTSLGAEGQMVGTLEAIYRPKNADYMVLTITDEQYAVLHDATVYAESWVERGRIGR